MIIDAYDVQSSSQRSYTKVEASTISTRLVSEAELGLEPQNQQQQEQEQPADQLELAATNNKAVPKMVDGKSLTEWLKSQRSAGVNRFGAFASDPNELKIKLLELMMYALTGKRISVRDIGKDMTNQQQGDQPQRLLSNEMQLRGPMREVTEAQHFLYESESVNYQAQGIIKTADGKSISVDVSMSMSREFVSYSSTSIVWEKPVDPLVINYGGTAASLTEQKYDFDLTMDGTSEQISFAGPGSGFLAADWNDDGSINDGSELFGPQNGDGFAELRKYDQDGNGWIDERDDIFDKLLVWSKDEDGNDQLFKLKDVDVGAIYLGNVDTQFSLNNTENQTQGVMQSTSFFLKESGGAGTISQVDLMI